MLLPCRIQWPIDDGDPRLSRAFTKRRQLNANVFDPTQPGYPYRQSDALLRRIRDFFHDRDFVEVLPRVLADHFIVDTHIDPVVVSDGANHGKRYLQPSPELAMKQMLAMGSGSIFSIGPCFRAGEEGQQHRTEFTMVEWYEVGADKTRGIETLRDFSVSVLGEPRPEVVTYREAFLEHLNIDPLAIDDRELVELSSSVAGRRMNDETRDDQLDLLLSHRVQPRFVEPTVLTEYPISQAALARPSEDDVRCAARFEWFAGGIELGNGYDELTDVTEAKRRHESVIRQRSVLSKTTPPPPTDLWKAMESMPPSAGVAVGFERMLVCRTAFGD